MGLDIGPKSIETLKKELSACKTIVWNGPMGVFEFEKFSRGTFDLCKIMADVTQQGAITIIGGGDVVAAVHEGTVCSEYNYGYSLFNSFAISIIFQFTSSSR